MRTVIALIVSLVALLAGCRGDYGSRCENPERYVHSGEMAPVRVPDDLSVPSEDEALRIPQGSQAPTPDTSGRRGPCLESPPAYLEGTAPGAPEPAEDEAPE